MKLKHTSEPWKASCGLVFARGLLGLYNICVAVAEGDAADANAERIAACVSACKGIRKPEVTVPELVKLLRKAHDIIAAESKTMHYSSSSIKDYSADLRRIKKALAKAETKRGAP